MPNSAAGRRSIHRTLTFQSLRGSSITGPRFLHRAKDVTMDNQTCMLPGLTLATGSGCNLHRGFSLARTLVCHDVSMPVKGFQLITENHVDMSARVQPSTRARCS